MRKALENYDGLRPSGDSRTVRECAKGGYSLSRKRVSPLNPREKGRGEGPSTPDIAGLQLEELHALRNRVRCTWLRHESLLLVTTRNRALLPWGACDVCLAADCVRNSGIAALAALMSAPVDGN